MNKVNPYVSIEFLDDGTFKVSGTEGAEAWLQRHDKALQVALFSSPFPLGKKGLQVLEEPIAFADEPVVVTPLGFEEWFCD